jgi:hypothetical protein
MALWGRFPSVTGHRPVATKVVNRARIDIMQTAENEPGRRGSLSREFLHCRERIGLASRLRERNSKVAFARPRRAEEL